VQARTSEIQRLGKALESAASSSLGCQQHNRASATAMTGSLIDGERRGGVLADWPKAGCGPREAGACRWR